MRTARAKRTSAARARAKTAHAKRIRGRWASMRLSAASSHAATRSESGSGRRSSLPFRQLRIGRLPWSPSARIASRSR